MRVWFLTGALIVVAACGDPFSAYTDLPDAASLNHRVGETCETNRNCRPGLLCTAGTCQPTGSGMAGAACQLTADCAGDLYCGPSRTCEAAGDAADGGRCDSTRDCSHGLVCVIEGFFGRCRAAGDEDVGESCTGDMSCLAGLMCIDAGALGTICASPPVITLGDGGVIPPALPYWAGETCETDTGAARSYFDVPRTGITPADFYRLPFPNDIRRTASGLDLSGHPHPGTVLTVDVIDRYLRSAEDDVSGFSTNPVVYFRFSKAYDWGSVGGRIRLVDITLDSPTYGRDLSLGWLTTAGSITRYICPDWLGIRTPHGSPLRPGTTYAAIVSTGILTAVAAESTAESFARSSDFDAMLSDSVPGDPSLMSGWTAYAPLRAWIAESSVDPATLLNAAVFTTQSPETLVPAMRAVIRARVEPAVSDLTLCESGVTSPCDDGTDERACGAADTSFVEIHGHIALPIFQAGSPPYLTPEDGGGIELDGTGAPMVARTEQVCFALSVPRDDEAPADGYPLLVFAHGTGGSFTNAVQSGIAAWAATGTTGGSAVHAATLGIDMPQHGSRRGGSTEAPDGLFFNFVNPRAARDNVLQGSADLMALAYWASTALISESASPTGEAIAFNAARIVLFAHSQGSTHASPMLPYEPAYMAAVLSGNGGDLTQSLLTKTEPVNISAVLPFALLDPDSEGNLPGGDFHPVLALFQTYFDRADAVNYAWRLWREPVAESTGSHVFMTYGTGDSYSTPATMQAFARAASLIVVQPVIESIGLGTVAPPLSANLVVGGATRTIGMRQYAPAAGEDGHFVAFDTEGGQADTQRFLLQALSGLAPEIGEADEVGSP